MHLDGPVYRERDDSGSALAALDALPQHEHGNLESVISHTCVVMQWELNYNERSPTNSC